MEVFAIPVPCLCAPDEAGEHPIEVGATMSPLACVLSLRTPCDRAEADAVSRLGGKTCIDAIDAIREILCGRAGSTPGLRDTLSIQLANALPGANSSNGFRDLVSIAEAARAVRNRRASDRQQHTDYFAVPLAAPPPPAPSFIRHLQLAEQLFAERVRRAWIVPLPPNDVRLNLRLAQPQIQISWGLIERQTVFEFLQVGRRNREPGWRLKQSHGADVAGTEIEHQLDAALPAVAMRGAFRLWKRP
jgi:hypothetical protein